MTWCVQVPGFLVGKIGGIDEESDHAGAKL
jgi:hypothetical protein